MTYRICGHLIMPSDIAQAPKSVRVDDMPEKCHRCRENGILCEVRLRYERKLAEQRMLEGMRDLLPSIFGGICRGIVGSVDERVQDLWREWEEEVDAVSNKYENKGPRDQW